MLTVLMKLSQNVFDQGIESILDMEKAIVQSNLHGGNSSILTLEHTVRSCLQILS